MRPLARFAARAAALAAALVGGPLAPAVAHAARAPGAVIVESPRGEQRVPVRYDRDGAPVLPAPLLADALDGGLRLVDGWGELTLGERTFRFLVGSPLYDVGGEVRPLASASSLVRDTLLLPFQFVAEVLPAVAAARYRYDARTARLVDLTTRPVAIGPGWTPMPNDAAPDGDAADAPTPLPGTLARPTRPPAGRLRAGHVVTIDPGHGGVDPGNPGLFFPRGLKEKDVTLQIGLLVRDELRKRGVAVRMTRSTDTLIALGDRGGYCTRSCDLFVSIHVNSLPKRPGYTSRRGFETYFLAEAKTEDAARVARMENEAVRFEASRVETATGGLDFILKDLQLNEHLRESAVVAQLMQAHIAKAHDGPDQGVKQAGFMVLTTARRPAVLVELGYSTNPEDAKVLTGHASQVRLAGAIADAVVEYLGDYERRTGAATTSTASGGGR